MADASGEPAPRSDLARAAYAGAEAKIRWLEACGAV